MCLNEPEGCCAGLVRETFVLLRRQKIGGQARCDFGSTQKSELSYVVGEAWCNVCSNQKSELRMLGRPGATFVLLRIRKVGGQAWRDVCST